MNKFFKNFEQEFLFFPGQCELPLGVEDNSIPDSDMTASSVWDLYHAPSLGRLNNVRSGYYIGGWAPQVAQPGEWMQVSIPCNVYTTPVKFKNAALFPQFGLPSTLIDVFLNSSGVVWTENI